MYECRIQQSYSPVRQQWEPSTVHYFYEDICVCGLTTWDTTEPENVIIKL